MAAKSTKTSKAVKAKATKTTRVKLAPKQEKLVFRMGTWITIIVLAMVVGAAIYMNRQAEENAAATETPAAEEEFIFTQDVVVNSIEVKPAEGDTVKLERNESQTWVLTQPDKAEADQSLAEAAASQIAALRIITPLENVDDLSAYGFDEPDYIITISFEDGTTNVLEIGDTTISGNGYYVRMDDNKFYVVSLSGISALTTLAAIPPYLNTPTPIPTATSTPLPT